MTAKRIIGQALSKSKNLTFNRFLLLIDAWKDDQNLDINEANAIKSELHRMIQNMESVILSGYHSFSEPWPMEIMAKSYVVVLDHLLFPEMPEERFWLTVNANLIFFANFFSKEIRDQTEEKLLRFLSQRLQRPNLMAIS